MSALTILCVTRYEKCTDSLRGQMFRLAEAVGAEMVWFDGREARCIEDVLDDAVATCPEGHILRLDDDERCGREMRDWLKSGAYEERDHWAFRRANLYPDKGHYITSEPLWPDFQTRLSTKRKSGGRTRIHVGSPFGTGWLAAPVIEHHKFLVRSGESRQALLAQYEAAGASEQFRVMSLPELAGDLETAPVPSLVAA